MAENRGIFYTKQLLIINYMPNRSVIAYLLIVNTNMQHNNYRKRRVHNILSLSLIPVNLPEFIR